MKKLLLLIIAILGSIFAFWFIDNFITNLNLMQYIYIELIITVSHMLYNKAKNQIVTSLN